MWSVESGRLERTLEGPPDLVAFSPDGRFVATASAGTVRLFRSLTWEHLRDISGDDIGGHFVAFSPDGGMLVTLRVDHMVILHDPISGNPLRTLENIYAKHLVFSPDGRRIATVAPDGSARVSMVPWSATLIESEAGGTKPLNGRTHR